MDIVFNLAKADGYEAAPLKEKVLKDFLEEHAEFKAKPSFAIVDSLPEIPDDDAPEAPASPATAAARQPMLPVIDRRIGKQTAPEPAQARAAYESTDRGECIARIKPSTRF